MFPFRVKYTESESDVQIAFRFTTTPQMSKYVRKIKKSQKEKMYKLHNLYFVLFGNCVEKERPRVNYLRVVYRNDRSITK